MAGCVVALRNVLDFVWRAEIDVHRTERRPVPRHIHRHDRRAALERHMHSSGLGADVFIAVAPRPFHEHEQLVSRAERLRALFIDLRLMCAAPDEDDVEFLHHPSEERHTPQLFLRQNPDHLRAVQRQHDPDWVCHAGMVRAQQRTPRRNQLPPMDVKNRMPEKQPDPADPPAKPIPERHPSFLRTISRISCTDCSIVLPDVSSFTASRAGRSGAISRSESCLSRFFISSKTCA